MKNAAEQLKALSEEVRLRILCLLGDGELCVCDLIGALGLPQSTISRHLAYLKKCGWVESRRVGVWMHYRLNEAVTPLQSSILEVVRREIRPLLEAERDAASLALCLQGRGGERLCGDQHQEKSP